jgi:hypothetical protein
MNQIVQMGLGYLGDTTAASSSFPGLDSAAATLVNSYSSSQPDCSQNSTVAAFQQQWNSYVTSASGANQPSAAIRTDGVYDSATQSALTQALQTSTTGQYAGGSTLSNLPTAPAAASCPAATTTTPSTSTSSALVSTSAGPSTTTVLLIAVGVLAAGGTAWYFLATKYPKGGKRR